MPHFERFNHVCGRSRTRGEGFNRFLVKQRERLVFEFSIARRAEYGDAAWTG